MIKLHLTFDPPIRFGDGSVAGESLWAFQISGTTGKIANIPMWTDAFSLGDLVEFDADREIIAVLERGTRPRLAKYHQSRSDDDGTQHYLAIKEFFEQHDVLTEGLFPGLVALAVPNDLDDDQLAALCYKCPVALTLEPPKSP